MADPEDWHRRWREGRIGFHLPHVNPDLQRFHERLAEKPARVLVPLCGKTVDMAFLQSAGHRVVGVELVEQAVQDFFAEANEVPVVDRAGPHPIYRGDRIEIHVGDILRMPRAALGPVEAIYDRAALIALPADERRSYAARLLEALAPGGRMLLVTLAYDARRMQGPPYSVEDDEVRALYEGAGRLQRLDAREDDEPPPRLKEQGLEASTSVWLLERS